VSLHKLPIVQQGLWHPLKLAYASPESSQYVSNYNYPSWTQMSSMPNFPRTLPSCLYAVVMA